jgi:hypothetical protein
VTAEFPGSSSQEGPVNLLSSGTEPWNKWCQTVSNHSWIEVSLTDEIEVAGLGFKSANDCPERDPDEIDVSYCSASGGGYISLGTIRLDFGSKRFRTAAFAGLCISAFKFRFEVRNSKSNQI